MIQILVIDDDELKRKHIIDAIRSIPELASMDVSVATNLVEARDHLNKQFFDLVVLDILLPPIPGEMATPQAGIHFLRELRISNT